MTENSGLGRNWRETSALPVAEEICLPAMNQTGSWRD